MHIVGEYLIREAASTAEHDDPYKIQDWLQQGRPKTECARVR
jgi:hypothetical protein